MQKLRKVVEKHVWTDYLELVEDYRHTPTLHELYKHRKETIEQVFADAKEKCAMRFIPIINQAIDKIQSLLVILLIEHSIIFCVKENPLRQEFEI